MAMITLKEYAQRHGKFLANVRRMAAEGRFKTAVKMGRDWFIDSEEPLQDARVKSGKYVGWRQKYQNRKEQEQ